VPADTGFASTIVVADAPIVVLHTPSDSRQVAHAPLSTTAFATD
jgi:hypothetical protein